MQASFGIFSSHTLFDIDASAFIGATGITDATQKTAINTLVIAAKINGWWTKCSAIYPVVGGTSTKHSYNLKNTTLYQITFSGSWVHASTGMTSGGSPNYADTGLISNSVLSQFSSHISMYSRSASGSVTDAGAFGGGIISITLRQVGDTGFFQTNDASQAATSSSVTDGRGLFLGSRQTSTDIAFYRNGTSIATNTGLETGILSTNSTYLGAVNSFGSPTNYSNMEYSFITIGNGISSGLASTMYTDIQAFQTSLSRQV